MKNEINYVSPFKKFCITIGNLPTAYIESMSYYEGLTYLVNYLSNNVIPALNNNSAVVEELQEQFTILKNYVDNYFENLDVQEEINNKLDEMVENGTLYNMVKQYINEIPTTIIYNTVTEMKAATDLENGNFVQTLGFHSVNDEGKALYKIRIKEENETANEMNIIEINSTLVAELIENDKINIKQLGAYGNNTNDDSDILQYAIDNYKNIIIPDDTFLISKDINISLSCTIEGTNKNSSILHLSSNKSLLLNNSFITIRNLKINLDNTYSNTAIKLLTPSNVVSRLIENINIIGDSTGNGIGIYGENNHGSMNDTISFCTFNKLNAAIIVDIDSTTDGWNSALKVENCWEWSCVYGMYWTDASGKTNNCYINNYKAQYTNSVTTGLIYNLKGNGCTVDNCFIWDGGITLQIDKSSQYASVRNITIADKFKYKDYGFRTRYLNIDQQTGNGRFYEFQDNFFGSVLSRYDIAKSESSTVTSEMVAPTTGEKRPAIKLTTGATTNDYAILRLGTLCLNDSAMWTMDFDLYLPDITDVAIFVGGGATNTATPQGNFICLNTAIDNNIRAVDRTTSSDVTSVKLIDEAEIVTNKWYHCQIKYISQELCYVYINSKLVGEFDSHRYDQQPYFYIKTLEDAAKSMAIANLYFNTYVY